MATATKHPHMQDASNGSVRVEIFDQGYNLRGTDPDPSDLCRLIEVLEVDGVSVHQGPAAVGATLQTSRGNVEL